MAEKLAVVPMTLAEANAFVERHHRHSVPTVGHKFSVGAAQGETVVGVGIVGRPVARHLDDGWTLEVLRVCTDGTRNACSILYATCWRAARALGYRKLVTYTRKVESGSSLRAAGWKVVGEVSKRSWPLLGPLLHDDTIWVGDEYVTMWEDDYAGPELNLVGIDWLIVGGESGPKHRPTKVHWVRDLRDACTDGVPSKMPYFFFKQWGGVKPTSNGRELDGRTWDEMPS